MFLNRLYSNKSDIFPDIIFNRGLNVIFARVKHRADSDKDSHNLGKTLLIDLLEFTLLKKADKDLFLKKHHNKFQGFEFYLDIGLCDGKFLTIKRSVEHTSKVSFKKHESNDRTYLDCFGEDWDHEDISFKRAVMMLDSYLALRDIKPWPYRKGVSYLLRKQWDYQDPFQIAKYIQGDHKEWKPYMAKVLGLDDELLSKRYTLEDNLENKKNKKSEMQKDLIHREEEYDKIKGRIEIKRYDLKTKSKALDEFDFHQQEMELNTTRLKDIETQISVINNQIYNIKYDLEKIRSSMKSKLKFDIKLIDEIFNEAELNFPNQLKRGYEDLIVFNKKISKERDRGLKVREKELDKEYDKLSIEHESLSKYRQKILKILKGKESLRKFKDLQKSLDKDRADLIYLESQFAKLEEAIKLNKNILELKKQIEDSKNEISEMIQKSSQLYRTIQREFTHIIRHILNNEAILSIELNSKGNVDFKATFVQDAETEESTSEADGTSYKKLLCMAFDIAVLRAHHKSQFFHFVYHDGALETLDDRKKLQLLDVVRKSCEEYGIQYLMSAIEDDLPRDEKDERVEFMQSEIIRELHDEGRAGRLFKMSKF